MKTMFLVVMPRAILGKGSIFPDPGLFKTLDEAVYMADNVLPASFGAIVIPVRVGQFDLEKLETEGHVILKKALIGLDKT